MYFRGKYAFLSNFAECSITILYNGEIHHFSNAEAAYQACKDPSRMSEFENLDGYSAKKLGKKVSVNVEEWNSRRDEVMQMVEEIKYKENPWMLEQLKKVKGPIVETNTWGDQYWGVCRGKGQNKLGKILEGIRDRELSKS